MENEPELLPTETAPNGGSTGNQPSEATEGSAALEQASRAAISDHIAANAPKTKKRGGIKQYPRAGSRTGPGNGAAVGETPDSTNKLLGTEEVAKPFDEKGADITIDGCIDFANGVAENGFQLLAKFYKFDEKESDQIVQGVIVTEKPRTMMKAGAMQYAREAGKTPSAKSLLWMGLGLWASQMGKTWWAMRSEAKERQKLAKEAEAEKSEKPAQ